MSYANPKGCQKSTTQYAKISFESNFGINISTKKINLLDINKGSDFVNGIKNLCKVLDATKDAMDFLDNPLKELIQETIHTVIKEVIKNIFRNTPLRNLRALQIIYLLELILLLITFYLN